MRSCFSILLFLLLLPLVARAESIRWLDETGHEVNSLRGVIHSGGLKDETFTFLFSDREDGKVQKIVSDRILLIVFPGESEGFKHVDITIRSDKEVLDFKDAILLDYEKGTLRFLPPDEKEPRSVEIRNVLEFAPPAPKESEEKPADAAGRVPKPFPRSPSANLLPTRRWICPALPFPSG